MKGLHSCCEKLMDTFLLTFDPDPQLQVFELLKTKSKYRLDRVYVGGSAGKKTAVMSCDFDCVVFVNDEEPPFKTVLDDFQDILTLCQWPKLSEPRVTRFSIQFTLDGYEIDLLPAPNYVNHRDFQPGNPTLAAHQAWKVLQKIDKNPKKSYHFSSGLCETSLAFMRKEAQSDFMHKLIRLCKFWNNTLDIKGYVSGRSTLIELVAVYAGQKEERKGDEPLLSGLQTFLSLMANFKQLKIKFDFDHLGEIRHLTSWSPQSDLHRDLVCPYVIEPVNPFNNLAKGLEPAQIEQFVEFAKESLKRLRLCFDARGFLPLDIIFEPQPKVIFHGSSERVQKFWKETRFLVGSQVNVDGAGSNYPSMTIRKEEKYKDWDMQAILGKMKQLFGGMTQSFVSSLPREEINVPEHVSVKLQERMQQCVDVNVKGVDPGSWSNVGKGHEDCDVTFVVPCEMEKCKVAVTISLYSTD